ncbi:MAG: CcmD family protein [Chloroflexi bacterium]|nr:CcmD family protein [Chloroflexota bacterium]
MQNGIYLFTAYGLIWLVLFGYTWSIGRRLEALRDEIEALKQAQE